MKSLDKGIGSKLIEVLSRDDQIAAAYLFGSYLNGNLTDESDVDFGILFKFGKSLDFSGFEKLADKLSDIFKRTADIVLLNDASPIICMQVLKYGKKIYEVDSHAVNEFFIKVVTDYADLKIVRRPIEQRILAGQLFQS